MSSRAEQAERESAITEVLRLYNVCRKRYKAFHLKADLNFRADTNITLRGLACGGATPAR